MGIILASLTAKIFTDAVNEILCAKTRLAGYLLDILFLFFTNRVYQKFDKIITVVNWTISRKIANDWSFFDQASRRWLHGKVFSWINKRTVIHDEEVEGLKG